MIFGLINSNPKILDSMPFRQSYTTKIYGFLKWVCLTDNDKSSSDEGAITSYLLFKTKNVMDCYAAMTFVAKCYA